MGLTGPDAFTPGLGGGGKPPYRLGWDWRGDTQGTVGCADPLRASSWEAKAGARVRAVQRRFLKGPSGLSIKNTRTKKEKKKEGGGGKKAYAPHACV